MQLAIFIIFTGWVLLMSGYSLIIRWPKKYPKWKVFLINFVYTFWGILMGVVPDLGILPLIVVMVLMWLLVVNLERRLPIDWSLYSKWKQFVYCGSFVLWGYTIANFVRPYAASWIF